MARHNHFVLHAHAVDSVKIVSIICYKEYTLVHKLHVIVWLDTKRYCFVLDGTEMYQPIHIYNCIYIYVLIDIQNIRNTI